MRLTHIVFLNIFLAFVLLLSLSANQKINFRDALFSSKVDDQLFYLSLDELKSSENFIWYSKKDMTRFENLDSTLIKKLILDRSSENSSVDKVKNLVLNFSRNGIESGCGEYSHDLVKNIEWVVNGHGCCSDHAQVFLALALLNHIQAREVRNARHTFNEYWAEDLGKWVWLDPQFALMAKDDKGVYLSLVEIHNNLKRNKQIIWDFFGTKFHVFSREDVDKHYYYKKHAFGSLVMILGNNVFQEDEWNKKLLFAPKSIRQFGLHVFGIKPGYAYFVDPIGQGETFSSIIRPYQRGLKVYVLVNAVLLLWWLFALSRARRRAGA